MSQELGTLKDLHRYHNINTDKIYKIEHQTPLRGKEKYLSSFDILIIGMAIELKKIHIGNNEVILLTRDGRLINYDLAPRVLTRGYKSSAPKGR